MGRKKIDKTSIEYLCGKLRHQVDIIGFQYTFSHDLNALFTTLNKSSSSSSVLDLLESELSEKIGIETIGATRWGSTYAKELTQDQLISLKNQFLSEGYEVEYSEFGGGWTWFRVKCEWNEIANEVEKIKEKIKL